MTHTDKHKLLRKLTDIENILVLKEMLAGEEPTLLELTQLNNLRQEATKYGYSLPKSKWIQ